jgi:hypothetical protein
MLLPHARLLALIALSLVQEDDGWRLPYSEGDDEFCEFPLDPLLMTGQPIGQYHCPFCGSMVVAAFPHPDYGPDFYDDLEDIDVLHMGVIGEDGAFHELLPGEPF